MARQDYIMGIDAGTSGIKALAFSFTGKLIRSEKRQLEVLPSDHGRMEHDAEIIYTDTLSCITDLIRAMGCPPFAIGFCTFMHSIMAVDEQIKPLGNLQLWNDNRSAPAAGLLKNTPVGNDIYLHTGTPVHPVSPLTKIRQMHDSDPEVFTRAYRFIGIKEYLLFKFTGRLILDYSTASATGLFDSRKKTWYPPALDWCGIKASHLAEPVSSRQTFRCILEGMKDILIVPGLSDGAAANLGAGNIGPAECTLTLGTSGAVRFTGPEKTTDPEGVLFSYCLDEDHFISGGASNNCFNVIEKVISPAGLGLECLDDPDLLSAAADNLLYLPWMFGERAPLQLLEPLSGFIDLPEACKPVHRVKSAVTCVLFNLRHIAEKLSRLNSRDFECIHLSGGLTNIQQIRLLASSVFNLPLVEHSTAESSALGTAMYTARAAGIVSDYKDIRQWNPIMAAHLPDPIQADRFGFLYLRFREITREYVRKEGKSF
jgi:gluconokinase